METAWEFKNWKKSHFNKFKSLVLSIILIVPEFRLIFQFIRLITDWSWFMNISHDILESHNYFQNFKSIYVLTFKKLLIVIFCQTSSSLNNIYYNF